MFQRHGSLDKIVLPPTRVFALVCQYILTLSSCLLYITTHYVFTINAFVNLRHFSNATMLSAFVHTILLIEFIYLFNLWRNRQSLLKQQRPDTHSRSYYIHDTSKCSSNFNSVISVDVFQLTNFCICKLDSFFFLYEDGPALILLAFSLSRVNVAFPLLTT